MRAKFGLAIVLTASICANTNAAQSGTPLSSAFVTGSKTYTVGEFTPLIGPHIGEPVSRTLIDQICAEIQALYRRDGYVEPTIIAPDSELSSSTPRLHIFEAQIAEIEIRGDPGPYFETIMAQAAALQSSSINRERSRRYLRSIAELPGLQLRAAFEPRAGQPSSYVLVLNVTYQSVSASVSVHNRGTADLGRTIAGAQVSLNGLLGAQEALTLTGAAAPGSGGYQYVGARLERRFGGTQATIDMANSRAEPEGNSNYSAQLARLELKTTAFDDGATRVEPLLAIAARDSDGKDSQRDTFDTSRTRTLEAGLAVLRTTPATRMSLWSTVTRGLDDFGAAAFTIYGAPPDLAFTKTAIEIGYVRSLSAKWQFRLDLDGQWSGNDLPAAERFTFGGSRFGRAFDPAELIGDSGAAVSVQVGRSQIWQDSWIRSVRMYVQADYGYARYNRSVFAEDAASITAGVSGRMSSMMTSFELSKPVDSPNEGTDPGSVRAFFYMQMGF